MEPKFHSPVTTHLLLMDDFCNPPETEKAKTREVMMSEKGKGKVVCVTGASGYIASWLVKLLVQHGYTVRDTVRDPNDPKKTEHLRMLDGAKERLHLFKAELIEEGSFDSVVHGCDGVFHTASPVNLSPNDPQLWYQLSKTLAEDAAWNFAKENGTDVVTLHPGFVLGPLLLPSINYSTELFLNIINGVLNPTASGIYEFVNVRDVVNAHIQAFERPSASDRYLLVGSVAHVSEVVEILHKHYPSMHVPERLGGEKPLTHGMSKEKAESLGLNYTPLEVSVTDIIESLKDRIC